MTRVTFVRSALIRLKRLAACVVSAQCRRVVIQVIHQYQRHRDVKRQRHVVVNGHLPQLVCHRRQILSVRRTELLDEVRVLDL